MVVTKAKATMGILTVEACSMQKKIHTFSNREAPEIQSEIGKVSHIRSSGCEEVRAPSTFWNEILDRDVDIVHFIEDKEPRSIHLAREPGHHASYCRCSLSRIIADVQSAFGVEDTLKPKVTGNDCIIRFSLWGVIRLVFDNLLEKPYAIVLGIS